MAVEQAKAYDDVYSFLTSSPTPEQIIAYRPSEIAQTRVRDLLDANRTRHLTEEEQYELNEFGRVEHFMRMLKGKARQKLAES